MMLDHSTYAQRVEKTSGFCPHAVFIIVRKSTRRFDFMKLKSAFVNCVCITSRYEFLSRYECGNLGLEPDNRMLYFVTSHDTPVLKFPTATTENCLPSCLPF